MQFRFSLSRPAVSASRAVSPTLLKPHIRPPTHTKWFLTNGLQLCHSYSDKQPSSDLFSMGGLTAERFTAKRHADVSLPTRLSFPPVRRSDHPPSGVPLVARTFSPHGRRLGFERDLCWLSIDRSTAPGASRQLSIATVKELFPFLRG